MFRVAGDRHRGGAAVADPLHSVGRWQGRVVVVAFAPASALRAEPFPQRSDARSPSERYRQLRQRDHRYITS